MSSLQVLDALQFLHHRGIVHLNIQPDNVIMNSRRRFDVKLIDFGQAHTITSADGQKVERTGSTEFMGQFLDTIYTHKIESALHFKRSCIEEDIFGGVTALLLSKKIMIILWRIFALEQKMYVCSRTYFTLY